MGGKYGHDLVAAVMADIVSRGVADMQGGVGQLARQAACEWAAVRLLLAKFSAQLERSPEAPLRLSPGQLPNRSLAAQWPFSPKLACTVTGMRSMRCSARQPWPRLAR
ncbi:MAG TPA: hypothetical protein VF162_09655 [Streptosporangiaceae bacterium]